MKKNLLFVLHAFITLFWVTGQAFAGDTTYTAITPATQTVIQGSSGIFKFNATSPVLPSSGQDKMTPYDSECVLANFLAKDTTFMGSPYDFSGWLAVSPTSYCYSGPSVTGPEVTVTVNVPTDALIGTYGAKLVAKGPLGIGWGEAAGVHIAINVVKAASCDNSPPAVTIYKPTEGENFTLGKKVPVEFTAVDEQSPITGWTAFLNSEDISSLLTEASITDGVRVTGDINSGLSGATPTPTITKIGNYTLRASATSQQQDCPPLTGSADRHFNINYNIYPGPPQMDKDNLICDVSEKTCGTINTQNGKLTGPADLQIKFAAKAYNPPNGSTEVFVSDTTVKVVIKKGDIEMLSRIYGDNPNSDVTIGTDNYLTKVDNDIWKTWSYETYTIYIYFKDYAGNYFLQYSKSFTIQP